MTQLVSLASSSRGNAALLIHKGAPYLLDGGISARRICAALAELGVRLSDLRGILVTHEHRDHTAGLPNLLKNRNVPIYTSYGTHKAMQASLRHDQPYWLYRAGDCFLLDDLQVQTFKTPHDTAESNGFLFDDGREKIAFATDLGYLSEENSALLCGAKTVFLEANYDREMLFGGSYPYHLKERIAGLRGHQDNRDCGDALVPLVQHGATQIMLLHLSRENNRADLAYRSVCGILQDAGIAVGADVSLAVAPHDEIGRMLVCAE